MRRRRIVQLLTIVAVCAVSSVRWARSTSLPDPSGFYVVSVGFSDVVGGWHHSILEARQDGGDVFVRYIRVVPSSAACERSTRILATGARLPNTSLPAMAGGLNLCAVDTAALARIVRAFPETLNLGTFAGDHYSIVASCSTGTNVIRLPDDWTFNIDRLKQKRPAIAALWSLEGTVGTKAFGEFGSLETVPPRLAARLQPADEGVLAELKSGRFDAGFAPKSFKDDVAALRPPSDVPEFSVTLANAGKFRFDHYVEPQYPPQAKQAKISGNVELELTSNPATGAMERVTAISGNPLLARAAEESAHRWRIVPGTEHALHSTRVVLEFVLRCP
jgi:Gram-negative bacterial TonB protein C-terminal